MCALTRKNFPLGTAAVAELSELKHFCWIIENIKLHHKPYVMQFFPLQGEKLIFCFVMTVCKFEGKTKAAATRGIKSNLRRNF